MHPSGDHTYLDADFVVMQMPDTNVCLCRGLNKVPLSGQQVVRTAAGCWCTRLTSCQTAGMLLLLCITNWYRHRNRHVIWLR